MVEGGEQQPVLGGIVPELQRSVSDSAAETTMSDALLMHGGNRYSLPPANSAVSLMRDLGLADVTKL